MADKYIFTMLGLNKFYGTRQVLKDINLCFFPGAKIGIVGPTAPVKMPCCASWQASTKNSAVRLS